MNPHYISRGRKSGKAAAINFIPQPLSISLFNFSHKWPTFAFTPESGYTTLGSAQRIAHKGTHGETRGVSDGGGITTLGAFRTFTNIPGPGVRTGITLPLLGLGRVCSRRTQKAFGTAMRMMRVAVPRRRGPAGLRDSVSALWIMW